MWSLMNSLELSYQKIMKVLEGYLMKEFTETWEDHLAIIFYYEDILKVFILEDYRKSK